MTLRPAYEAILRHGDHAVTLRASLRAAITIAEMDGGFPAVLSGITALSFRQAKAVIRAAATSRHDADAILSRVAAAPLQPFMEQASAILLELIARCLPTPDKDTDTARDTGEGKPWQDHFADLYGFATGWLGWPPETAWSASCDEITTAFDAHTKRLIAMNGGDPDKPETDNGAVNIYSPAQMAQIDAQGHDPAFDRSGLHALKARL